MKIRPLALAAIAAAMLALTGCASSSTSSGSSSEPTVTELRPPHNPESLDPPYYNYAYYMTLPDGYKLLCIFGADDSRGGGPSCNWDAYNKHLESKELPQ